VKKRKARDADIACYCADGPLTAEELRSSPVNPAPIDAALEVVREHMVRRQTVTIGAPGLYVIRGDILTLEALRSIEAIVMQCFSAGTIEK
jgi:hypothetical protein